MSLSRRWRCFKIVDEEDKVKDDGLQGSLINAMERGQDLRSAAQSLVNAGYNIREVQKVVAELSDQGYEASSEEDSYYNNPKNKQFQKKKSKKEIIILIVIALLIIVGGVLIAFFWREIFDFFNNLLN